MRDKYQSLRQKFQIAKKKNRLEDVLKTKELIEKEITKGHRLPKFNDLLEDVEIYIEKKDQKTRINNSNEYSEYVAQAKFLMEKIELYQAKIAKIAIKVCTIRHGGISDKYYTLSDFARDTGINRKTLSQWVRIYEHILKKIEITEPNKKEWESARKVLRNYEIDRTLKNKNKKTERRKTGFIKNAPKDEVHKDFKKAMNGELMTTERFNRAYKSFIHVKGVFANMAPGSIDQSVLMELIKINDEIRDILKDHLKK